MVMNEADFQIQLIADGPLLLQAEENLRRSFGQSATFAGKGRIGFQGGSSEVDLFWHDAQGIWGCIDGPVEPPTRFWNGFGTTDPRQSRNLSIVCEVNPARTGVNAQVSGAFGRGTDDGHTYLLHRGRIGGGRSGIGQELFFEEVSLPIVSVEGTRFVVVADLDAGDVPGQVAKFVHEIERIKKLAEPELQQSAGGRYGPLADWLAQQSEETLPLTFAAIEDITGKLPRSAREHAVFWRGPANTSPSHVQKHAWESAGFTVTGLDLPGEAVTFGRLAAAGGAALEGIIQILTTRTLTDGDLRSGSVWRDQVRPLTRPFLEAVSHQFGSPTSFRPVRDVTGKRDGFDQLTGATNQGVSAFVSVGLADEEDGSMLERSLIWGLYSWGKVNSAASQALASLVEGPYLFRTIDTGVSNKFPGTASIVYRTATIEELRSSLEDELVATIAEDLKILSEKLDGLGTFGEALSTGFWWVNQGSTYALESAGGYVWAPQRISSGAAVHHHVNVSKLRAGDRIVHYANGSILALGTVMEDAQDAPRPAELPEGTWEGDGRLARVRYQPLTTPLPITAVPTDWRIQEANPFNRLGGVQQGYMFPISVGFWRKLLSLIMRAQLGESILVGAVRAPEYADVAMAQTRQMIERTGREAQWWSYPLQDSHLAALHDHPYLYFYVSSPMSKITHRARVLDTRTTKGPEGIPSPWPDNTAPQFVGGTNAGDTRDQLFKSWLLVDALEELPEPLGVEHFQTSAGGDASPSGLLGGFGLWKFRSAIAGERSWIFQSNPAQFDLRGALKELKELVWTTRQHAREIHVGHTVYLWEAGPNASVLGIARVTSEPEVREDTNPEHRFYVNGEKFAGASMRSTLEVIQVLDEPLTRAELQSNPVLQSMTLLRSPQGTNFALTQEESAELARLVAERVGSELPTLAGLAALTHMPISELEDIESLLREKKQIILEGPPGTGKTYIARLFARYFTGNSIDRDPDERVQVVQFHQSYGYEEFIQGIRPATVDGVLRYDLQPGIFKRLCTTAAANPTKSFVLIIDEINRGNISRIFGELLYLLEYREQSVHLGSSPLEEPPFSIPSNVYLIGTMNTTDRSLAQIDYALRRRFFFYRLMPVIRGEAPVLSSWLDAEGISEADRNRLVELFVQLNSKIVGLLGEHYQLGHSYLMKPGIERDEVLGQVWQRSVLPLLEEYFHNQKNLTDLLESFSIQRLLSEAETPG